MDQISQLIEDCLLNPKYKTGRDEVRKETWEHIGLGATKTVDYLLNKYEELQRKGEE